MSESEDVLAFGASLSDLVSEVANQMSGASGPAFEETGAGLNLPALMLETSHCCQLSAQVSSSTVTGLGELLDLVLSQDFGYVKPYRFVFLTNSGVWSVSGSHVIGV